MATERYKLKVMPRAAEDLDSIYEYISEELAAPLAAHNQLQKFEDSFMRLRDFPELGLACQDDILKQKGYRKLIVNNYIGLYLISHSEKTVIIIRVVHSSQDYVSFV